MVSLKTVNEEEWVYTFSVDMNREQLRLFYTTMAQAHKNWAGGHPAEQELLQEMRNEAWKLLLEAQFQG